MFEAVELGRSIEEKFFLEQLPELRTRLLAAQRALRDSGVAVVVILAGVDGAGKSELVHSLNEWFDPRGVDTHGFAPPTEEERERPWLWRYWRALPRHGRVATFFGSWYSRPLFRATRGRFDVDLFEEELRQIAALEQALTEGGFLLLKFWLHVSNKVRRKRLRKRAHGARRRALTSVEDGLSEKVHQRYLDAASRAIRSTDTVAAPWLLVEAEDDHYRDLTVARTIVEAIENRLAETQPARADTPMISLSTPDDVRGVLDRVDLGSSVVKEDYERELAVLQGELETLTWRAYDQDVSSVLLFEGWDAAGKGGAIRRLVRPIDPRLFKVVPVAAPTEEERAHHYLWRFWRPLPRAGMITIFDRSWYGRVLVERVESLTPESAWRRAYQEINAFEAQLVGHGVVLLKFWLHISENEQLRRFEERRETPFKQHKITEEDWRNRSRRDAYWLAVNEMVERTSMATAPWTLVPANNKRFARIKVLRSYVDALKARLA